MARSRSGPKDWRWHHEVWIVQARKILIKFFNKLLN
jgi:hypothetical protein